MCGIVGLIGGGDADAARRMAATIAHRGPDGIRVEAVETDRIKAALAHARLSIIDLEGGWQPLHAAGCTVIGNGEIYNYKELIEEFGLKDRLRTGSDFEPLLHLYALQGEKAFDRLRGMYAFCLIGHDGRVWLVRDPFGIKPLYWRQAEGMLQFASEPRALLGEAKGPVQVEGEPLQELLTFNYSVGRNTVFRAIRRLKPGEVAEVVYGRPAPRRVRSPLPRPGPVPRDEAGLLSALDKVLEDSVTLHQRSDVPYGLFLSGGVDSSVIAAMMARLNERPVTAFTCGFETAPARSGRGVKDERAQAEKVARALNLDWREVSFGEDDFWRVLPEVANALDEPTTDYAVLPTYKLAEAARGELKVVLTGEGGDELFGGYGRYRRALRPPLFGGREAAPRAEVPFLKDHGFAAVERWRQATEPQGPALSGLGKLQQAQARDIAGWLPSDLLLKLDRCLMAHGLEGRTPFLDPEVARFAFFLPDRVKVRGRLGKWILRRWLQRHCPGADPFARKAGFTTPVGAWIAPRAALLGPKIAEVEGVRRFCEVEAVRAVFREDRYTEHRWPLLFLAVWWGIHVDRMAPAEALARLT